jgi:hypothetical protein
MKPEHKNMLLGFLAARSTQSSNSDDELNILQVLLLMIIVGSITAITGVLLADSEMSNGRVLGFMVLTFFVFGYVISWLMLRYTRFMYLLILGPPLAYFLIWLFFLSS